MTIKEYQGAIEALLFISGEPISADKISSIIGVEKNTVVKILNLLKDYYDKESSGLQLSITNGDYQIITREKYAPYVREMLEIKRNSTLTAPSLEVLAVIAYNQPVTKAFVEQVRGSDCSSIFITLQRKKLISEDGRLDLPGRPILYKTTNTFLKCMNIVSLDQLPKPPQPTTDSKTIISEKM